MSSAPSSASLPARVGRPLDLLVIHCTATPNGRWTSTLDIDYWHRQRGFARPPSGRARLNPDLSAIGYHWVIYANGACATGRSAEEAGAHAKGVNHRSLGLALVGTDHFTRQQWEALADHVGFLCGKYGVPARLAEGANGYTGICGHRELPGVAKECPGFSVADWIAGGMKPLAGHVLEVGGPSTSLRTNGLGGQS